MTLEGRGARRTEAGRVGKVSLVEARLRRAAPDLAVAGSLARSSRQCALTSARSSATAAAVVLVFNFPLLSVRRRRRLPPSVTHHGRSPHSPIRLFIF